MQKIITNLKGKLVYHVHPHWLLFTISILYPATQWEGTNFCFNKLWRLSIICSIPFYISLFSGRAYHLLQLCSARIWDKEE